MFKHKKRVGFIYWMDSLSSYCVIVHFYYTIIIYITLNNYSAISLYSICAWVNIFNTILFNKEKILYFNTLKLKQEIKNKMLDWVVYPFMFTRFNFNTLLKLFIIYFTLCIWNRVSYSWWLYLDTIKHINPSSFLRRTF